VILLCLGLGLLALLVTRSPVDTTLLRAPGALFQKAPEGRISNLYLLKLTNKTHHQMPVQLKLENVDGRLTVLGGQLDLPAERQTEASVLVEIAPEHLRSGGKMLNQVKTVFAGPRK